MTSQLFNTIALTLQVLSALAVILLVLLQHGKGADMGAAFGSGASGSLFGATGSANFLSRSTAVLASLFFASTLALALASVLLYGYPMIVCTSFLVPMPLRWMIRKLIGSRFAPAGSEACGVEEM